MGAADGEEAPVWFMERVCVTLRNGGASGVVKEINDNIARVECEDGAMSQLSPSDVIMVAPKEHDIVLVTGGADVGVEGELVCIDGTDAILKDSNEDFKIVDLVHLAKIVGDA
jgi:transcription elongation factor SPT5